VTTQQQRAFGDEHQGEAGGPLVASVDLDGTRRLPESWINHIAVGRVSNLEKAEK
jgi:hypothetical protein